MLSAMHFITRHALNFFISSALLIISIVNFDIGLFGLAVLIGGYYMSNKLILTIQKRKRSKELGMTKEEYKHIEAQIKLAREQLNNLTQQYIRVRSIKSFKLLNETNKVAKRIINIVHTNPQKFYAVEDFFYAHLPSAVELADKYTLLTKEQVKGTDIHIALEDTRKTLKDLHGTIENDLKLALQSDIDQLKIELDFAKLANEQSREKIGGGGE
ncbi:5-bromo-4-chloroindolyl phosphate hydrolysis family protein [Lysinibacillus sp. LZ02]|uniref:5-bromo-4-chloroindolyl phosphate hydrolysis family protein n=1 Tax=Lysinibacillus sp. LZ02 TaxID=3420668 RepID=UPI003D365EE9